MVMSSYLLGTKPGALLSGADCEGLINLSRQRGWCFQGVEIVSASMIVLRHTTWQHMFVSLLCAWCQSPGLDRAEQCVCTGVLIACLRLCLCRRLQSSGPSLITPLPSPSSTCTGKVSVLSKVCGGWSKWAGHRLVNPFSKEEGGSCENSVFGFPLLPGVFPSQPVVLNRCSSSRPGGPQPQQDFIATL